MSAVNLKEGGKFECCNSLKVKCQKVTCKKLFATCSRASIVLINLTFLVAGWVLIFIGLWLHINRDATTYSHIFRTFSYASSRRTNFPTFLPPPPPSATTRLLNFDNFPFLLISTGCFLAVTCFLGCCGACAESICFLSFHTLLTMTGIATEIVTASMSNSLMDQMNKELLTNMRHQVWAGYNGSVPHRKNNISDVTRLTYAWDYMQIQLECCGALGVPDYINSSWYNRTHNWDGVYVPTTCCLLFNDDPYNPLVQDDLLCQVEASLPNNTQRPITQLHSKGCYKALRSWMSRYDHLIITTLCILICTQVISLFFSCYLMVRVKKKHSEYSWCENDEFE